MNNVVKVAMMKTG